MNENIRTMFEKKGFRLTSEQEKAFDGYYDLLIEWNHKMNLTGITDERGVYMKHFLDSLMLAKGIDLNGKHLLDVGSGAGFPGIPLKIMFPAMQLTIIDALKKRVQFLEVLTDALNIEAALIHGRIEEHERKASYDVVTARAVAPLNTLGEFCVPFVKPGGYFVAYKSNRYQEEVETSNKALTLLGARLSDHKDFSIDGNFRTLLMYEKINDTPGQYPRKYNKIKSKPL
ncbi:MAG: 16S rRNA (guanine(527)-N(7))-methyltransferase RsmG [Candidatus Izemoplasmataceae bacterium]